MKLSVIITAYSRKEFLTEAVESLKMQTISRDSIELIIVCNFSLHFNICEIPIKFVFSDQSTIGSMLADGIREASGDVICFLDDDDLYNPSKLENVKRVFEMNTNVIYYHNLQVESYNVEAGFYDKVHFDINKLEMFNSKDIVKSRTILKMMEKSPDYNSSSICIRKDIVDNLMLNIKNIRFTVDTFLFAVAFEYGGIFVLDSSFLTFKRVHDSNSNPMNEDQTQLLNSLINLHKNYVEDYSFISGMLANNDLSLYFFCKSFLEKLKEVKYTRDYTRILFNKNIFKCLSCFRFINFRSIISRINLIRMK